MIRFASRALLVLTLLALASCQTNAARRGTGYPVHVVVCWLKTPGDEAARQQIIDVSRSFDSIPGVVKVAAGRAIPYERPVVDDSFEGGKDSIFGLAEDGVGLGKFSPKANAGDVAKVDEVKSKVAAGEIEVPTELQS